MVCGELLVIFPISMDFRGVSSGEKERNCTFLGWQIVDEVWSVAWFLWSFCWRSMHGTASDVFLGRNQFDSRLWGLKAKVRGLGEVVAISQSPSRPVGRRYSCVMLPMVHR
jgi:hypothetical protein